jgi:hypothetical protein
VLDARLPSGTAIGESILNSPKAVVALPQPVRQALQDAVVSSVAVVFQWALPAIVLAFLVSLLLREIPLRKDVNISSAAIEGMEEAGFGVLGRTRSARDGRGARRLAGSILGVSHATTDGPGMNCPVCSPEW